MAVLNYIRKWKFPRLGIFLPNDNGSSRMRAQRPIVPSLLSNLQSIVIEICNFSIYKGVGGSPGRANINNLRNLKSRVELTML